MLSFGIKFFSLVCTFRAIYSLQQPNLENASIEKLSKDVEQAVMHVMSDCQPAKDDAKANKWMVTIVRQAEEEELENALVAKIASINDVTLTAELVGLADGFRFIVPRDADEEIEIEERANAFSIVNMLSDLRTMDRVDKILANCSFHATVDLLFNGTSSLVFKERNIANLGGEYIRKLFEHWLRSVVAVLENDPHLSVEFVKQKSEARAVIRVPLKKVTPISNYAEEDVLMEEQAKKIVNSPLFHRMALNRLFLRQASKRAQFGDTKADLQWFLLARALIDLAGHHGRDPKANELYQNALEHVAKNISFKNTMDEIGETFFTYLQKKVEEDNDLSQKVKVIENNLSVWIAFRNLRRSLALI